MKSSKTQKVIKMKEEGKSQIITVFGSRIPSEEIYNRVADAAEK